MNVWPKGKKRLTSGLSISEDGTESIRKMLHNRTGRLCDTNPKFTYKSLSLPLCDDPGLHAAVYQAEKYIKAAFEDKTDFTPKAFWCTLYVKHSEKLFMLQVGVI